MKAIHRHSFWVLILCLIALTSWTHAWAGTPSVHSPRTISVVLGESVTIDIQPFDTQDQFGFGAGVVAPPNQPQGPQHGTAIIGHQVQNGPDLRQWLTYTHDGSNTSSDSFILEDMDGYELTFNVTITPPSAAITLPTPLPPLQAGANVDVNLSASGGQSPYTFTITGGTLPPGLSLATSGHIYGAPTARGSYSFAVTATDANQTTGVRTYAGAVANPSLTLNNAVITIPPNQLTSRQLLVQGGVTPVTFALESGTIPQGLSLSSSGLISGTAPSSAIGTHTLPIRITDGSAGIGSYFEIKTLTIQISVGTAPDAPTLDGVTPGNGQATLAFTPPGNDGGNPITFYTANCGGISQTGQNSPVSITGLTNGTSYSCHVTAHNTIGSSATSNLISVTPVGPPTAPTLTAIQGAAGAATLTFTPPTSNGGSAITEYAAICDPGTVTTISTNTSITSLTVGNLTDGQTYSCKVRATNAEGSSESGVLQVMPGTVPAAPTISSIERGNGQAVVHFTPPASSSPTVLDYTASCTPGTATQTSASSPITITGLTNGEAYDCAVTARNAVGTSVASAAASVTPATVPSAPTLLQPTAGNGELTLSFNAPTTNGGSPIISYTAFCGTGTTAVTGSASPLTVSGLNNGTSYTCSVTATNDVGSGPASLGLSETPKGPPTAPTLTAIQGAAGAATLTFTPPTSNGGSAITEYAAICDPGTVTTTSTDASITSLTVNGLTDGETYSCKVRATNAQGSEESNTLQVTAGTVPTTPTISSIERGNGQAVVHFTPPASSSPAVLDYTASCTPGTATQTGASSPLTVTGLTNGEAYNCAVTARNAVGTSVASTAAAVTPATVPDAPTITAIARGNESLSIAFTAPVSDGGDAVTTYTAQCVGPTTEEVSGTASPLVITPLQGGASYACTVLATNAIGDSVASAPQSGIPTSRSYSAASPAGSGPIVATLTGGGQSCGFDTAQFLPASSVATSLAGVQFPHGLFDFTAVGCDQGASVTIELTYPTPVPANAQLWKYGPRPNLAADWYTFTATLGANTITYTLTDGQLGDDDLTEDGVLKDPVGFGVPTSVPTTSPVPVPVNGVWMVALLAMLLGGGAWRMQMRRPRARGNQQT